MVAFKFGLTMTQHRQKRLSGNLSLPYSIFVHINGDIYVSHNYSTYQVTKWLLNANTSVTVNEYQWDMLRSVY